METTPGKRVQMLREAKGYTSLTSFAEFTKLKVGTLSALEKDKSSPSLETMAKLIEAFPDANLDWLVTGFGSMFKGGAALTPAPAPANTPEMEPDPTPAPEGGGLTLSRGGKHADPYVEQLLERITEQAKIIEKLWKQNDTLLDRKPDASADAADLYETIDQIQSEYLAAQAETPEYHRFQVGRPKVRRMEVAGFGRELA